MIAETKPIVAIIDYEMGNLFSIKHACDNTGMKGVVTSSEAEISRADAIILPGVGAYGDAIECLRERGLDKVILEAVKRETPIMAICLGMQLLMGESDEFGKHQGLGVIDGSVLRFNDPGSSDTVRLKVPQVGWNHIFPKKSGDTEDPWQGTPLDGITGGEFMYFVHSFYVKPDDDAVILSSTKYGEKEFCSSLVKGNIFACQFHPERSSRSGLKIYENFKNMIEKERKK